MGSERWIKKWHITRFHSKSILKANEKLTLIEVSKILCRFLVIAHFRWIILPFQLDLMEWSHLKRTKCSTVCGAAAIIHSNGASAVCVTELFSYHARYQSIVWCGWSELNMRAQPTQLSNICFLFSLLPSFPAVVSPHGRTTGGVGFARRTKLPPEKDKVRTNLPMDPMVFLWFRAVWAALCLAHCSSVVARRSETRSPLFWALPRLWPRGKREGFLFSVSCARSREEQEAVWCIRWEIFFGFMHDSPEKSMIFGFFFLIFESVVIDRLFPPFIWSISLDPGLEIMGGVGMDCTHFGNCSDQGIVGSFGEEIGGSNRSEVYMLWIGQENLEKRLCQCWSVEKNLNLISVAEAGLKNRVHAIVFSCIIGINWWVFRYRSAWSSYKSSGSFCRTFPVSCSLVLCYVIKPSKWTETLLILSKMQTWNRSGDAIATLVIACATILV